MPRGAACDTGLTTGEFANPRLANVDQPPPTRLQPASARAAAVRCWPRMTGPYGTYVARDGLLGRVLFAVRYAPELRYQDL
jgi:hypothetical protein